MAQPPKNFPAPQAFAELTRSIECPICMGPFEPIGCQCPIVLKCGHSLCITCAENYRPSLIPCPVCRTNSSYKGVFPKNYSMIDSLQMVTDLKNASFATRQMHQTEMIGKVKQIAELQEQNSRLKHDLRKQADIAKMATQLTHLAAEVDNMRKERESSSKFLTKFLSGMEARLIRNMKKMSTKSKRRHRIEDSEATPWCEQGEEVTKLKIKGYNKFSHDRKRRKRSRSSHSESTDIDEDNLSDPDSIKRSRTEEEAIESIDNKEYSTTPENAVGIGDSPAPGPSGISQEIQEEIQEEAQEEAHEVYELQDKDETASVITIDEDVQIVEVKVSHSSKEEKPLVIINEEVDMNPAPSTSSEDVEKTNPFKEFLGHYSSHSHSHWPNYMNAFELLLSGDGPNLFVINLRNDGKTGVEYYVVANPEDAKNMGSRPHFIADITSQTCFRVNDVIWSLDNGFLTRVRTDPTGRQQIEIFQRRGAFNQSIAGPSASCANQGITI